MKIVSHAEARIYIGSSEGYIGSGGAVWSVSDVIGAVANFQKDFRASHDWFVTARVTETFYIAGDYREAGYEVALLNYPRYECDWKYLKMFARDLAYHLLAEMKQNRLTVVFIPPGGEGEATAVLLESPQAQEHPRA